MQSICGFRKLIGADIEDLFHHDPTLLHDPAYRKANAGTLNMATARRISAILGLVGRRSPSPPYQVRTGSEG